MCPTGEPPKFPPHSHSREQDRRTAVAAVQQRAKTLDAKAEARETAQEALQRREAELRDLTASLAEELTRSQRLQQVSSRLVQAADFTQLLNEILDAAIDISHADMVNIQLLDGDALKLAAHRAFR